MLTDGMVVEVESTGASSQFYDKFNIRYNVAKILELLWKHAAHKEIIKAEAS